MILFSPIMPTHAWIIPFPRTEITFLGSRTPRAEGEKSALTGFTSFRHGLTFPCGPCRTIRGWDKRIQSRLP